MTKNKYEQDCCVCGKTHTVGATVRYTSNYDIVCEDDCSDDCTTAGRTTLEHCWWGYEEDI